MLHCCQMLLRGQRSVAVPPPLLLLLLLLVVAGLWLTRLLALLLWHRARLSQTFCADLVLGWLRRPLLLLLPPLLTVAQLLLLPLPVLTV